MANQQFYDVKDKLPEIGVLVLIWYENRAYGGLGYWAEGVRISDELFQLVLSNVDMGKPPKLKNFKQDNDNKDVSCKQETFDDYEDDYEEMGLNNVITAKIDCSDRIHIGYGVPYWTEYTTDKLGLPNLNRRDCFKD